VNVGEIAKWIIILKRRLMKFFGYFYVLLYTENVKISVSNRNVCAFHMGIFPSVCGVVI
jgi:hypothetical protein